ncbi:ABC transporter permease [Caballeronia ptereochthonis]|uniref:Binding-protein-dependent transport system inner membrane protein n=1 Tax=Caballeronia ptereochthonis TaxID=1777144 RepID=A0A157Z2R0_9BURK|nr:ABC transporter permease [Caballeronia ptereochthonis]SAK39855.1 binding-protein-dependent transport system inner membrane protein [Caballeronia ptereochthonis]
MHESSRRWPAYALSAPALVFYGLLLAVPLAATLLLSLRVFDGAHATWSGLGGMNYVAVFGDPYFHTVFARTFALAAIVTALCALLGTPEAIILSRMRAPWRSLCLVAILAPFLISVVVRTLGWAVLLGGDGFISRVLQTLGLTDGPVVLMYSMTGMVIALVHVLVPFMLIAVWVALQRCDPDVERAGASLGASEVMIFRRLVLPQIVPGIASGAVIVFSLAATSFATPAIIGGRRLKVAATAIYDAFLGSMDWPQGAALAVALLLANLAILAAWQRLGERRHSARSRTPAPIVMEEVTS